METGPWAHLDRRQERRVVWGGRHRFLLEMPANFGELRKGEVRRTHHRRISGSVKLHSWVTTLGQQGTEPDLRIYAVVHRREVVVLKFASCSEGGKSRLFRLDFLAPVQRVQRADERTRTADLISIRVGCCKVRLVPPLPQN